MTKKRTPRLDALLDKVERLCRNKSALARELGVSPQHVHMWITAREYEPGGETTLHLLEWATRQAKLKNKNRDGAQTPSRRKAHFGDHVNETRKTNQDKG